METQSQTPPASKNDTLFGGRLVGVTLNDGTPAQVKVRQLWLGDYDNAFACMDDEFALVAFCCRDEDGARWSRERLVGDDPEAPAVEGKPRRPGVTPDSYEALAAAMREVNAQGFFSWAAKRRSRLAAERAEILAALPQGEFEKVIGRAGALSTSSPSPSSSPRPRA